MHPIIEVRDLVKNYAKVQAVQGVSFSIPEGSCFGLLGPNGAGKTTTVEMMEGILPPTSGEILFRGKPIGREFQERTGIQFQSTALQDYLTVREVLHLFHNLYERHASVNELIHWCALEEFLDQDASELSGGQRQRLLLAVALVNDPEIVFLDEPTTGLDPQARRNFWDLVDSIKRRKKTVILTTHYMEEAYTLCDQIAIMDHGKIIARGAPDALLKEHFTGVSIELPSDELASAGIESLALPHADVLVRNGLTIIQTTEVDPTLKALLERRVSLARAKIRSRTLEDLFLKLTGNELRA